MSEDKSKIIKEAAERALVKEAVGFGKRMAVRARNFKDKIRFSSDGAKAVGDDKGMDLLKTVGVLAAAIGVNEFVGKMISYGKKKYEQIQEPGYYKKMLKENPQLMDEDPEEVMDLWNTLYHHSPHMAKDPVSAGAFITQSIQGQVREEFGGPSIDTYSTLNKIEADGISNKEKRYDSGKSLTDTLLTGIGLMG